MAGYNVEIGTSATVVFGTSGFTAELLSVNWGGYERESVETSKLATTVAKTFTHGDLPDPGTLDLEMHFNPDTTPPLTTVAETITLTFPKAAADLAAATWACSGFMTSFEFGVPLEDKMTATASCKLSGTITITPATDPP